MQELFDLFRNSNWSSSSTFSVRVSPRPPGSAAASPAVVRRAPEPGPRGGLAPLIRPGFQTSQNYDKFLGRIVIYKKNMTML